MDTRDLINDYYRSINSKDEIWKSLWSGDGAFSDASKTLLANGHEAVVQSFTPFLKSVKGIVVRAAIVEGEKACFIIEYTYINSKNETFIQDVAEFWEVRDEKLSKLTIYFDLTAYRNFMRGS